MLICGTDRCRRHVNGSRYMLRDGTPNEVHLTLAIGTKADKKVCVLCMSCIAGNGFFPIQGCPSIKFSAHACFGIAINKAYGLLFSKALRVDLRKDECSP